LSLSGNFLKVTDELPVEVLSRLDGYNLGAEFDLDHTTVELLNDAMQRSPGQHATIAPPRSKHTKTAE
jgi:hypothetical protein